MTEDSWSDELSEEEISQLDALLADPALWEEPNPADEDAIVSAILAEAAGVAGTDGVTSSPVIETARPSQGPRSDRSPGLQADAEVIPISRARRWLNPVISAAAGLVVAVVGFAALTAFNNRAEDGTVELALAGTELAPAASAEAEIVDLPSGTRIVIDVSMLDPAPVGSYYELWLRKDAEVGVSAGTFHLRGGDGEIELWAGVSATEYPLVTVTLQEETETMSSGQVVLKGLLTDS